MEIKRLAHYSIRTPDLEASRHFYKDILGLAEGFRPPFDFPGAWLYLCGSDADYGVVHLIGTGPQGQPGLTQYLGSKSDDARGSGCIDHVAFLASGLTGMRQRLADAGLPFRERTVPHLGLHQLFIEEPSGVTVELNFPAEEATEGM